MLLILLLTSLSSVISAGLTPEEIADAVREAGPQKYCGRRLTDAMKTFCLPGVRAHIMGTSLAKKSCKSSKPTQIETIFHSILNYLSDDSTSELEFDQFDVDRMAAESYDDDLQRSRTKIDELLNEFIFPSRRLRRGIIDECCKRACYKNELIRYCAVKS